MGLVFFDGHADFHNSETSPTGEAADFELAFLTGRGPAEITSSDGLTFEQTQDFLIQTLSAGYFLGMSVTCYHPNIDAAGKAGRRIAAVISNAVQAMSAGLKSGNRSDFYSFTAG